MAPNFCEVCGNILDISADDTVKCDCCGEINHNMISSQPTISKTNNFPSVLRTKLTSKTQIIISKDYENTKQIQRECPDCHAKTMTWSEAQLRSADEGTTIFYRCSCGYRCQEEN